MRFLSLALLGAVASSSVSEEGDIYREALKWHKSALDALAASYTPPTTTRLGLVKISAGVDAILEDLPSRTESSPLVQDLVFLMGHVICELRGTTLSAANKRDLIESISSDITWGTKQTSPFVVKVYTLMRSLGVPSKRRLASISTDSLEKVTQLEAYLAQIQQSPSVANGLMDVSNLVPSAAAEYLALSPVQLHLRLRAFGNLVAGLEAFDAQNPSGGIFPPLEVANLAGGFVLDLPGYATREPEQDLLSCMSSAPYSEWLIDYARGNWEILQRFNVILPQVERIRRTLKELNCGDACSVIEETVGALYASLVAISAPKEVSQGIAVVLDAVADQIATTPISEQLAGTIADALSFHDVFEEVAHRTRCNFLYHFTDTEIAVISPKIDEAKARALARVASAQ